MSDGTNVNFNFSWIGLLGVVLVVGKLMGKFDISWFWATAPFWFGLVIAAAILLVPLVILAIAALIEAFTR
jgi:hypothetical protein